MTAIKSVLVPLGYNKNDVSTIKYTAMMAKYLGIKKFYFLHVVKTLEISESLLHEHPKLLPSLDESMIGVMKEAVGQNWDGDLETLDFDFSVLEGSILEQILQHAKTKDVDLIILGNDKSLTSNSILAPQVANKAPCSVLSVPYETKPKIKRVVAGVDFSQHSKRALQMAIELKSKTQASIECVHAYKAPKGYAQAELDYDEIMKLMKANAIDEFNNFLSSIDETDSDVSCEYVPETDAVAGVRETLENTDADLLILGTRGRSSAAKFILGSVTEELLLSASVPIFAVKEKGENMDVLHALLSSSGSAG